MNKIFVTGNCTADPVLRTTPSGKSVCSFTVAANRRKKVEGQPDADFFRVTTWNALADNCAKYLSKGKKLGVVGSVSLNTYESNGQTRASMEVVAEEVEFLSPRQDIDRASGMQKVEPDDMPY